MQAAAGALINVTGQTCDDIVLCAGPREETADDVRHSGHGFSCVFTLTQPQGGVSAQKTTYLEHRFMLALGAAKAQERSILLTLAHSRGLSQTTVYYSRCKVQVNV